MWLPRWETTSNPNDSKIRTTSGPESRRSLGNRRLELERYDDDRIRRDAEFTQILALERQRHHFTQVARDLVEGVALRDSAELGADCDVPGLYVRLNGGVNRSLHDGIIREGYAPQYNDATRDSGSGVSLSVAQNEASPSTTIRVKTSTAMTSQRTKA